MGGICVDFVVDSAIFVRIAESALLFVIARFCVAKSWQSKSFNCAIDCHENSLRSFSRNDGFFLEILRFAQNDKIAIDSANRTKIGESVILVVFYPPPLSPSAREGENLRFFASLRMTK
ncbi:hypothetical protein ACWIUD_00765 [Helicobacter sp. 23-1044]